MQYIIGNYVHYQIESLVYQVEFHIIFAHRITSSLIFLKMPSIIMNYNQITVNYVHFEYLGQSWMLGKSYKLLQFL